MEELAVVNVLQSGHYLEQNALYTVRVHWLVIPCLHELVQITVHEFHGNVKPSAVRVQEDVQGWNQMRMWW